MKDGHICDKDQYLFQEKLLIIASNSYTVTNYCKSKSDIYSVLIEINLFKLEEHIIVCFTLLEAIMINRKLEHKHHNV